MLICFPLENYIKDVARFNQTNIVPLQFIMDEKYMFIINITRTMLYFLLAAAILTFPSMAQALSPVESLREIHKSELVNASRSKNISERSKNLIDKVVVDGNTLWLDQEIARLVGNYSDVSGEYVENLVKVASLAYSNLQVASPSAMILSNSLPLPAYKSDFYFMLYSFSDGKSVFTGDLLYNIWIYSIAGENVNILALEPGRPWGSIGVWALNNILKNPNPDHLENIKKDILTKITSPSMRFNVVVNYSHKKAPDSAFILRWYWDNYVHTAHELKHILDRMRVIEVDEQIILALIKQKRDEIIEMQNLLQE